MEPSPTGPPEPQAWAPASKRSWRSILGGNRTPRSGDLYPQALSPDVVISLVMGSLGNFCLCLFPHLLSKKWEADMRNQKDACCPLGCSAWDHSLSVTAKALWRRGKSQPCPEGEKVNTQGLLVCHSLAVLPWKGVGWQFEKGMAVGEPSHSLGRMACHQVLSRYIAQTFPPLSPARDQQEAVILSSGTCTDLSLLQEKAKMEKSPLSFPLHSSPLFSPSLPPLFSVFLSPTLSLSFSLCMQCWD